LQEFIEIVGGGYLLIKYNSLVNLLSEVYPEHEWLPGKFLHPQHNIWKDEIASKQFVELVRKKSDSQELNYLSKEISKVPTYIVKKFTKLQRILQNWENNKIFFQTCWLVHFQSIVGE
jgi:hypothetical protein